MADLNTIWAVLRDGVWVGAHMKSNIAGSVGQDVTQQSTHNLDLKVEHSRVVVVPQNWYPECENKSLTLNFSEKMGNAFYIYVCVCVCCFYSSAAVQYAALCKCRFFYIEQKMLFS